MENFYIAATEENGTVYRDGFAKVQALDRNRAFIVYAMKHPQMHLSLDMVWDEYTYNQHCRLFADKTKCAVNEVITDDVWYEERWHDDDIISIMDGLYGGLELSIEKALVSMASKNASGLFDDKSERNEQLQEAVESCINDLCVTVPADTFKLMFNKKGNVIRLHRKDGKVFLTGFSDFPILHWKNGYPRIVTTSKDATSIKVKDMLRDMGEGQQVHNNGFVKKHEAESVFRTKAYQDPGTELWYYNPLDVFDDGNNACLKVSGELTGKDIFKILDHVYGINAELVVIGF